VCILGSEDFVLALGRRHVTEIFPSPADLVNAIDQKWEELDNIIRTNQFPVRSGSEQRQESRHRHIHDFISCHDYEASDSILNHLADQKGIIIETVYSSALDNRVCVAVSIDLSSPGLTDSMDSPLYEHAPLLVPIPNVLKLERGLHQTLDWEAFHHIGGGIDLENTESGTEDIVEMELRTEYSGPMMHKLVLGGENVDLSVIFRRGVGSSDLKRSVTRWNSLLRERPDEVRGMLNSFIGRRRRAPGGAARICGLYDGALCITAIQAGDLMMKATVIGCYLIVAVYKLLVQQIAMERLSLMVRGRIILLPVNCRQPISPGLLQIIHQ
jgi:hypothetical protein